MKSLFRTVWCYLNEPAEDFWVIILAVVLCGVILLGLAYWVGPSILPIK